VASGWWFCRLNNDHGSFDRFSQDLGAFGQRVSARLTKGKNPFVVVFDAPVGQETGKVLVANRNKIWGVSSED